MNRNYSIIGLALLCTFAMYKVHGVIVDVSCLKNTQTEHKVVLLHDYHDIPSEVISETKGHQKELQTLINVLSQRNDKSTFFLEYPYRTTNFDKMPYKESTMYVPIKNAVDSQIVGGALSYKSFDERIDSYFGVTGMIDNIEAIVGDDSLWSDSFEGIAINTYLSSLHQDAVSIDEMAKQMPGQLSAQIERRKNSIQQVRDLITKYKSAEVAGDDHIFDVIETIPTSVLTGNFYTAVNDANGAYTDVSLWNAVINDTNKVSVVHGGAYHTGQLEKALTSLSYFYAFDNISLHSGFRRDDTSAIIALPTRYPQSFIGSLHTFLSV